MAENLRLRPSYLIVVVIAVAEVGQHLKGQAPRTQGRQPLLLDALELLLRRLCKSFGQITGTQADQLTKTPRANFI